MRTKNLRKQEARSKNRRIEENVIVSQFSPSRRRRCRSLTRHRRSRLSHSHGGVRSLSFEQKQDS
ncbi:uncharacterized protein G2W53_004145 [Senna tora]|uniref:Uncharacterized protein n=1 Tax=Senna tora TaxID=362788 RepID=A0A835CJW9_9FABA|nr:uncharacterized protein G2W53_004145 [Senna tora]